MDFGGVPPNTRKRGDKLNLDTRARRFVLDPALNFACLVDELGQSSVALSKFFQQSTSGPPIHGAVDPLSEAELCPKSGRVRGRWICKDNGFETLLRDLSSSLVSRRALFWLRERRRRMTDLIRSLDIKAFCYGDHDLGNFVDCTHARRIRITELVLEGILQVRAFPTAAIRIVDHVAELCIACSLSLAQQQADILCVGGIFHV